MKFTKSSGQTAKGPEAWFTGTVFIDTIRNPDEQSCIGCAHVRFTPGARTAWHTHRRVKPCTSPTASATSAAAVAPLKRSDQATSCTSNPTKTTGTEQQPTAS